MLDFTGKMAIYIILNHANDEHQNNKAMRTLLRCWEGFLSGKKPIEPLDLSGCELRELPSFIELIITFVNIPYIILSDNLELVDISWLSKAPYAVQENTIENALSQAQNNLLILIRNAFKNGDTQLTLSFDDSIEVYTIPVFIQLLTKLVSITVCGDDRLASLQGLQNLPELTSIVISDSFKLTNLYGLQNLPKLTSIEIYCADSLVSLKGLHNLPKLTHIDINNSSHLTNFNEHDLTDWLAQVQVSIDGKIINDNCTIHSLCWPQYTKREHLIELRTYLSLKPFSLTHYRQSVHAMTQLAMQTDIRGSSFRQWMLLIMFVLKPLLGVVSRNPPKFCQYGVYHGYLRLTSEHQNQRVLCPSFRFKPCPFIKWIASFTVSVAPDSDHDR